jgi:hypothetical protein
VVQVYGTGHRIWRWVMSGSIGGTVTVVQPGEGEASGVGPGIGVVFKIDGQDTGGAVSIVE